MAIAKRNIKYYLSGGAGNSDPDASLGGAISTTRIYHENATYVVATAFVLDDVVAPTTPNGYLYECTTAGTTAGSEPTWGTTPGGTTSDGTAVWTCRGLILNNLFDNVSGDESESGDVEYRCLYVDNDHGSLTYLAAKAWIPTNTPSGSSAVELGIGTSGVNGTEQTIANESTAPSAVSFDPAANEGAALTIGNMPAGQHMALWLERTITASAPAYDNDGITLRTKGQTAA